MIQPVVLAILRLLATLAVKNAIAVNVDRFVSGFTRKDDDIIAMTG